MSAESEHRAAEGIDFIAKSSSVEMLDSATRATVTVTILPVSRSLMMLSAKASDFHLKCN